MRQFGLGLAGLVVLLFGLVVPWLADEPLPVWPWWLGGGLAVALFGDEAVGRSAQPVAAFEDGDGVALLQ